MALNAIIAAFKADVAQCDSLIMSAHRQDAAGLFLFPTRDREQITVAAFLNLFISWEQFVESTMSSLMMGAPTIGGTLPVKYVSPNTTSDALAMLIGTQKYFDFANHQNVRKIAQIYFQNGYPYEPHLGSIYSDLEDLRAMRNASAHISSTTQKALEALAGRLLGLPQPGITLYTLLTTIHPTVVPAASIFAIYRDKLSAAADLIANG